MWYRPIENYNTNTNGYKVNSKHIYSGNIKYCDVIYVQMEVILESECRTSEKQH